MGFPSLPYILELDKERLQGQVCFTYRLIPDYVEQCTASNTRTACEYMRHNYKKVVFWYRLTQECGFDLSKMRENGTAFPWSVYDPVSGKSRYAARYKYFAKGANRSHAVGDVTLFKWNFGRVSSVEVNVARSQLVQRPPDTDVDGYKLCLVFDPSLVDVPTCISNANGIIQYSVYDAAFKISCTVGAVSLF